MESLLECVPNVSEANETSTLDAISEAARGRTGVWLLDRTSDVDHARSVFTLAGAPPDVMAAMQAVVSVALERVDMRRQRGQHPRIGAIDVVPFVPLGGTGLAACAAAAHDFGAVIAERFELPVYLYGAAARRPERRILATIRRPGYEGLAAAMRTPAGVPDLGPARPHPTAGATAVGARPVLIAWNIQLTTNDVAIARRMAAAIRERDGGLPRVQALGLELLSHGRAQLSMNVLDHERTPLWRVWEEADRLAGAEGVGIVDSELIGLIPKQALLDVADHIGIAASRSSADRVTEAASWLAIRDFDLSMVLEVRLRAVRESC